MKRADPESGARGATSEYISFSAMGDHSCVGRLPERLAITV
jgi:hypothetical protein